MLLQQLSELAAPSGYEDEVRKFILNELKSMGLQPFTDAIGNVLVSKGEGKTHILLTAHMDEIGLMISGIEKNGLLRIEEIGGIDNRFLISKTVLVGEKKVPGVIGAKAIHLQEPEERNHAIKRKELYIDIGAKTKEDAEKYVQVSDYAIFDTPFMEKELVYAGKAFDDRLGCALLIDLLKNDFNCSIHAAFTAQEEVGLRGAMIAAQRFDVDMAVVLEATAAHDTTGAKHLAATRLHQGPVLTVMDSTTIASKELTDKIARLAEENNIPYQYRGSAKGGNDAGSIHIAKEGIPTAIVSVPCRYIHTPVSMIGKDDFDNAYKLVKLFLKSL